MEKQLEDAKARASAQLHSPACPPPAHLNPERCGLLVTNFPADEMDAFISDSCGGVKDKSCDSKIDAMIAKRWETRYPKADRKYLRSWCAENAEECKDSARFEAKMIESHNEAVLAELKKTRAKIRKAAKEEAANEGSVYYPGQDPSPAFQQQQHQNQQMHMMHHVPPAHF
jgi:hypothetical protein